MSRAPLPSRYEMPNGWVLVDDCSSLTGWTLSNVGSGGTTAIAAGQGPNGEDVMEFTVVGAADQRRATKTISVRNAGSIGVWVRWPDYPTASGNPLVYFTPDAFTNYFANTIAAQEVLNKINGDGWEFRVIPMSQFANQGGAANSWGLTQTSIRLIAKGSASLANVRTQIGPIYANLRTRPKIMLMFDDANASDYLQSKPVLDTYGFVATSYIIKDKIGTTDFLTMSQVQELYAAGWDIGGHHLSVFRGESYETQLARLVEIRDYLLDNGLTRGALHFSYPEGKYDQNTNLAMSAAGMRTGRTVIDYCQSPAISPELYRLHAAGQDTALGSTGASALAEVDDAIKNGASIGLFMHGMSGTGNHWNTTDLGTLCAGLRRRVNQGLCDVVTISEFYDGLSGTRPPVTR